MGTHIVKLPDIGEGIAEAELVELFAQVQKQATSLARLLKLSRSCQFLPHVKLLPCRLPSKGLIESQN